MVEKYSHGTPDDWVERAVYSKHSAKGIILMFLIDLVLFGVPGITIWAIQMIWIPLFAAGVINGIGHHVGYRNFECHDASTNIVPWGFWIGGEELHNNHHTFASSAKFSVKWFEFDLGWFYIRCLSLLGLAKVKKLPPELGVEQGKLTVDLETVKAVIHNRFQVMSHYYRHVIRPMIRYEKKALKEAGQPNVLYRAGRLFRRETSLLSPRAQSRLQMLLATREKLGMVYQYRQSLEKVWLKTASSQKELVESLSEWVKQAEESGVEVLQQFARQMKSYVPKTPLALS
jgi:stearoyl-CoA desaturase (delta-9 desaturase)